MLHGKSAYELTSEDTEDEMEDDTDIISAVNFFLLNKFLNRVSKLILNYRIHNFSSVNKQHKTKNKIFTLVHMIKFVHAAHALVNFALYKNGFDLSNLQ